MQKPRVGLIIQVSWLKITVQTVYSFFFFFFLFFILFVSLCKTGHRLPSDNTIKSFCGNCQIHQGVSRYLEEFQEPKYIQYSSTCFENITCLIYLDRHLQSGKDRHKWNIFLIWAHLLLIRMSNLRSALPFAPDHHDYRSLQWTMMICCCNHHEMLHDLVLHQ